ncbi:MAG TPA: accessory factor UbiK family protein [Steroidobacteraceae bacterium]
MEGTQMEEMARRFVAGLPAALDGMRADLEANFRAVLQSAAGRLDLTSRSEFDVQSKVLERSRERIAQLEARLGALEERLQQLQQSLPPVSD